MQIIEEIIACRPFTWIINYLLLFLMENS